MSSLLDLPLEVRFAIYRELAKTAGIIRLREQIPPSAGIRCIQDPKTGRLDIATKNHDVVLDATKMSRSQNTGCGFAGFDLISIDSSAPILHTSRQIRSEAAWEFFHIAPIHLSIRSRPPLHPENLPWLKKVRKLSIDYSFLSSTGENGTPNDRNHNWRQVDQDIAAFINIVSETCQSLSTFTLHILSDRCCDSHKRDFMHDALQSLNFTKVTAEALANLVPKIRDLITFVAFGNVYSYYELRNAISPGKPRGFAYGRLDEWPEMKLDIQQQVVVDSIWQDSTHMGMAAIYAWLYKMPTSEIAESDLLPSWHFLDRHKHYIRDRESEDSDGVLFQENDLERTLLLRSQSTDPIGERNRTDEEVGIDEGRDNETDDVNKEDVEDRLNEESEVGNESAEWNPFSPSTIAYHNSFF